MQQWFRKNGVKHGKCIKMGMSDVAKHFMLYYVNNVDLHYILRFKLCNCLILKYIN